MVVDTDQNKIICLLFLKVGGCRKSKQNCLFVSSIYLSASQQLVTRWQALPPLLSLKQVAKNCKICTEKLHSCISEMHFMHLQLRNASYAWLFDCSLDKEIRISVAFRNVEA